MTESPTAPRGQTLGHSVDLLCNTNVQEMLHFSIFLDQIKCGSACSSSTDRVFNFIIVGSQLSTLGLLKHPGVGATGVRLMATQRVKLGEFSEGTIHMIKEVIGDSDRELVHERRAFQYYFYLFFFNFIFKLYKIVLVLPNIKMNPPQVYMRSPS